MTFARLPKRSGGFDVLVSRGVIAASDPTDTSARFCDICKCRRQHPFSLSARSSFDHLRGRVRMSSAEQDKSPARVPSTSSPGRRNSPKGMFQTWRLAPGVGGLGASGWSSKDARPRRCTRDHEVQHNVQHRFDERFPPAPGPVPCEFSPRPAPLQWRRAIHRSSPCRVPDGAFFEAGGGK